MKFLFYFFLNHLHDFQIVEFIVGEQVLHQLDYTTVHVIILNIKKSITRIFFFVNDLKCERAGSVCVCRGGMVVFCRV